MRGRSPARRGFASRVGLGAAVLTTVVAVGNASAEHGVDRPPPSMSLPQLRAAMIAAHECIRSLYIECRSDYPQDGTSPAGAAIYRIIACKRPGMFFYSTAKGHSRLDWHDDPSWQHCYVFGNKWYRERVVWRAYSEGAIGPRDGLPEDADSELFFLASGIWPFDLRAGPKFSSGASAALRDVANDEHYALRATEEECDGRLCHVLEGAVDALWIDVNRGCAVLAREVWDKGRTFIASRFELRDHREIATGVWIPRVIHNVQYSIDSGGHAATRIVDSLVHIHVARANNVQDEIFAFEPPPGALRLDSPSVGRAVQTRPGGREHLDRLVEWTQKAGLAPRERKSGRVVLAAAFSLGILGGLAIVAGFPKARRHAATRFGQR